MSEQDKELSSERAEFKLKMATALRRAYNFGQTYWQQADSESYSQNRKSDETAEKFAKFIMDTCEELATFPQLPVAEQPAGQAVTNMREWQDKYLPQAAAQERMERDPATEITKNVLRGDYAAPHSPVAQMNSYTADDIAKAWYATGQDIRGGSLISFMDALHASQPTAPVAQTSGDVHAQLRKFYGVDNDHDLIEAQANHIERLQAKLPQRNEQAFQRVREG